jgi:phytol kinase
MIAWADLAGAGILTAAFGIAIIAAEIWSRTAEPNPEWTRKLVHLVGGVACLFFPFLIRSPWVVLVMAVAMSSVFAVGEKLDLFKSLSRVERKGRGSEYYPLSIFLVFVLSEGQEWLYVASVLVLAFADAGAALVGSHYGKLKYTVDEGHKSLEGSVFFMMIAFLAVHLPVLLMTDISRPICVLSALLIAFLVTGLEAISSKGTDNLFVPVAVAFVLKKITAQPLSEVIYQNASLAAIAVLIGLAVWRIPSLNVGTSIAVILFIYATWSLGSETWALPIIIGFVAYLVLVISKGQRDDSGSEVRVRTVFRALLPLFLVLMLANTFLRYGFFFGPYATMAACTLGLILHRRLLSNGHHPHLIPAAAGLAGAVLAVFPAWWMQPDPAPLTLLTPAAVAIAAVWSYSRLSGTAMAHTWDAGRFSTVVGAGLTVALLQLAGLPQWSVS